MTHLLQPILSALVGLALLLYGLIHSASNYPGSDNFRALWQSMPAFGSVGIFALGLAAVACGLTMLSTGVTGIRRRYQRLDALLHHDPREFDEDGDGYYPEYRR